MTQVSSATPDVQLLLGMTLDQLQQLCAAEGMPRFAAKQICDWLYAKHVDSIDAMTNLSLKNRSRLKEMAVIGRHAPVECQVSRDGTKKYLFQKSDDPSQFIESVFIPDGDRGTLCVSCQAGCKMGCRFCVTGMQGFHGNLSAAEFLNSTDSPTSFIWAWVNLWTTLTMFCAVRRCLLHRGGWDGAPIASLSPLWASFPV